MEVLATVGKEIVRCLKCLLPMHMITVERVFKVCLREVSDVFFALRSNHVVSFSLRLLMLN